MSEHDNPTIAEGLDQIGDDGQRDATRRRVTSAQAELETTAEHLVELVNAIPSDLDEMTEQDLRRMLKEIALASNCLQAEAQSGRVALEALEQVTASDATWDKLL